jgi:ATP-dependent DNA helicase RecG
MRSAADLIAELNAVDESHAIEAKAGSEVGRSIMETVCAFANEPDLGGGYLLLGVERVAGTLFDTGYVASGLDDPEKVQSDLVTQCSSMFNKPIRPRVAVEQVGDKTVVVAFIPEAAATEKPIFLTNLGLPRGAFRRLGPTDHQGTEDDLIALYADHKADTFDSGVIGDATLDDIDPAAIQEYRSLREKVNSDAEELSWSDEDLLRAFGCIAPDDGDLKPTVAGILLFGTPLALRRCFPMMRVDYIRVQGREWVQDPDHRFDTVEIRAPLITAIRRATNAVLDDIPRSFSLPSDDIQSEETPLLPTRVIREAVVNAVMHRSYRIHGSIQIIRYANRLEIRNPGHSLKAEEQLGQPGSETRNPRIAAVLHEVNIAETKGSGIRVMRELMQQSNLLPPTLESSRQPDQFVATFLFHHFLGQEDLDWLAGLTSERLSDEESRALVFVRELGAINNAAYREINRTETLDASTHLRRLRDLNLLEKKGSGNRTYYVPGPGFRAAQVAQAEAQSRESGAESREPGAQSRELGAESRDPDGPLTTGAVPAELRAELDALSKRPKQQDLRRVIRDLCTWAPLTSARLAELLDRRQEALVRDHLRPMIEGGELAYTIPAMPHHPDQAYTVPSREDGEGPR